MQFIEQIDLFSAAHESIAHRPMGYSVLSLLSALYGDLPDDQRRHFMGVAMPSVDTNKNLGNNRWVNTKILEPRCPEPYVIVSENGHRKELIVAYWHDRLSEKTSESVTYGYADIKLVVDEVSYFLRHATKRAPTIHTRKNVVPFKRPR